MKLDELKSALESDATKRATAQEKTIRELHSVIKARDQKIVELEKDKRQLLSRCKAITNGLMCFFCKFKKECKDG